ncbi:MAG: antibiotic biosynthesis monooxygenase [Phycisphaeraceae bacterium]|nr:antibiotic biosynthesis monooxygenase [Phycisphaeraceae bacterium]MBX3365848.1 antibiotic biosynthesis monooxygenase [Phycisphaeraceae bacterium]QYK48334.1 MAG: antibiotic biosynthesis monooxygenase [Phycisphaeraceae bacterium]
MSNASEIPTSPDSPALRFLRTDATDPPVTVIRDIRVRPGAEGRFELLMGALIAEATSQPGHLGATVLRPVGGVDGVDRGAYRFVYKFDKRSNLLAWHSSKTRAELFAPIAELVRSDRFEEYPGLETWFDLPPDFAPPKWKTTLMSWAAIYVLVVALSYIMQKLGVKLPIPLAALVLTGIIVPLVAYVVGPLLGRVLRGWLHAGPTI